MVLFRAVMAWVAADEAARLEHLDELLQVRPSVCGRRWRLGCWPRVGWLWSGWLWSLFGFLPWVGLLAPPAGLHESRVASFPLAVLVL